MGSHSEQVLEYSTPTNPGAHISILPALVFYSVTSLSALGLLSVHLSTNFIDVSIFLHDAALPLWMSLLGSLMAFILTRPAAGIRWWHLWVLCTAAGALAVGLDVIAARCLERLFDVNAGCWDPTTSFGGGLVASGVLVILYRTMMRFSRDRIDG